ncbi:MAG TPA: hypothetical protein IAB12_06580 [Candidatus Ornithospirochaeta avicola]|uniref:Uncharacterized protein n=1 Tax=Candidatus Ornithospirochaeta avicola TaxID=2840896 RepID=A0A9D1TNW5_9SPIO|nr:hypothetical protein [Candidatus Ornithospirochaeta avicola]
MLEYRRLIEFTSRIHTYLLCLLLFFSLCYILSFFISLSLSFASFSFFLSTVLIYLMLLLSLWILFSSIHISLMSSVVVYKPFLMSILRLAGALFLDAAVTFFHALSGPVSLCF